MSTLEDELVFIIAINFDNTSRFVLIECVVTFKPDHASIFHFIFNVAGMVLLFSLII